MGGIIPSVKRFWAWISGKNSREVKKSDFREFVYLDEISVVSLLVSRRGDLTEQIQEGYSTEEAGGSEVSGTLGVKAIGVSSKSNFQTKSSQSVQATRKANIQSQFRRLHQEVKTAGLLFPAHVGTNIETEDKLLRQFGASRTITSLKRGSLVELDVQLRADRLFSMGSIITEVATMGEDHPELFGADALGALPKQMKSFGKLLDQFMAGLVPIRSPVTNVRSYEKDGCRYLVDAGMAQRLQLVTQEIELVAVLDRDRFWKDMRRVLFSDAEVTVLGRLAADGIRESWSPVKLLDLFASTIPGGETLISGLQSVRLDEGSGDISYRSQLFRQVLAKYADSAISNADRRLSVEQSSAIAATIDQNSTGWASAEAQRNAFRLVSEELNKAGLSLSSVEDAELRRNARMAVGMGSLGDLPRSPLGHQAVHHPTGAHLLEVEVVAMYW